MSDSVDNGNEHYERENDTKQCSRFQTGCCCTVWILAIVGTVLMILSFAKVEKNEMCLMSTPWGIEDKVYDEYGLYFIGINNKFICFPEHMLESHALIDVVSSDNITSEWNVEAVWTYNKARLEDMYLVWSVYFEKQAEVLLVHTARDVFQEYNMTFIQDNRDDVASRLLSETNAAFEPYATVELVCMEMVGNNRVCSYM